MKLVSTFLRHTQILQVKNTPTEIFQFTGCANMQTLKNSYLCPLKNFLIAEILLHTAVCNKSSTNITNKLLEHYLGSVKIKDHQEAVPLYIGLVSGSVHASGDSLVHLLFGFYPEAKKCTEVEAISLFILPSPIISHFTWSNHLSNVDSKVLELQITMIVCLSMSPCRVTEFLLENFTEGINEK